MMGSGEKTPMAQSLSKPQSEQLEQPEEPQPEKPKRKFKPLLLIPLILGLIAAGVGIWYGWFRPQPAGLELSGRIEGYETDIGARVAGRVESVVVREGERVRKGQIIVQLDDAQVQAQLQGAIARLQAAEQQAQQANLQIGVINSQIQEAQLNYQQSQGSAEGQISQSQAQVATAEAQLNQAQAQVQQAQAELNLAKVNRDRYARLVKQGAVARQQFDQAQTSYETALSTLNARKSALNAAQKQVNAAQGQLTQAQTTSLNPEIRNTQLDALRKQLAQQQSQLKAAQAEVANAQAAKQEIQAQMSYLKVVSPIDGVVTTRSVEPGEVVTNGRILLSVINLGDVYLRGFVPEGEIGQIRVGQPAKVFLDSAPDQALPAQVAQIDTQASFTPENIYFRQDRVQQVFGVKLRINNPAGFAKPGMPADGEILTPAAQEQE